MENVNQSNVEQKGIFDPIHVGTYYFNVTRDDLDAIYFRETYKHIQDVGTWATVIGGVIGVDWFVTKYKDITQPKIVEALGAVVGVVGLVSLGISKFMDMPFQAMVKRFGDYNNVQVQLDVWSYPDFSGSEVSQIPSVNATYTAF